MAQLIVRNLDDDIVQALKRRAVEHGRSAEEEHRELLRSALLGPGRVVQDFKSMLAAIPSGEDPLYERTPETAREIEL